MKLCTCLANSREEHMIIQPDETDDELEEGDSSGSDDDSDSGSEHDSGEGKAGGGGSEPEGTAEANGQDAEGRGSHGGDERHTHKDGKKVGVDWLFGCLVLWLPQQPACQFVECAWHHLPQPVALRCRCGYSAGGLITL